MCVVMVVGGGWGVGGSLAANHDAEGCLQRAQATRQENKLSLVYPDSSAATAAHPAAVAFAAHQAEPVAAAGNFAGDVAAGCGADGALGAAAGAGDEVAVAPARVAVVLAVWSALQMGQVGVV